jgi:hypothetical protein
MPFGRENPFWQQALRSGDLPAQLLALRVLAEQRQAQTLLEQASPTLGYPLIWALVKCDCPELLARGGPDSPTRAARFLWLRQRHRPAWRKRANLQRCLSAIAQTGHPLRALACTVRLLELHKEKAIPGLLQWIQRDHHPDLCAWALAQLGLVRPLMHAFAGATPKARTSLAMALWYLGPAAAEAIPLLIEDGGLAARAALLAMREKASTALIAARLGPVWLDEDAVSQLALLAFDVDPRLRHYAAESLCGCGPAAAQAQPILRQMLRSNDYAAAQALTAQSLSADLHREWEDFERRNLPRVVSQEQETDPPPGNQAG